MKVYFLLFVFLEGLNSCGQKAEKLQSVIEFNIEKEYAHKTFDIHDVADVEYVLLKSTDSILFTHFSYLTDNYIVAFNYFDWHYVFFDKKGNPITYFSRAGDGPEEYRPFWLEIYCEDEDEFYIFSYPQTIQVYDRTGKYKRTLRVRGDHNIATLDALHSFNADYLLCHDKSAPDSNAFYLLSKKDGEVKDINIPVLNHTIKRNIKTEPDETGFFINIQFDICYSMKNGEGFLLNLHSTDTIFQLIQSFQLIPRFVKTPPAHEMDPPVLVNGFIETDQYCFFSTQEISYDFKTRKSGKEKGYVWDKQTKNIYSIKAINSDYLGQELLISPTRMFSYPAECSSNPHKGVLRLKSEDLLNAYSEGKLHGELKTIVESVPEEDLFILMIMNFR